MARLTGAEAADASRMSGPGEGDAGRTAAPDEAGASTAGGGGPRTSVRGMAGPEGARIAYEVAGSGPLLLIQGLGYAGWGVNGGRNKAPATGTKR